MGLKWPVIAIAGNDRWACAFASESALRAAIARDPELKGHVDFFDVAAQRGKRVEAGDAVLVPDTRYASQESVLRRRVCSVLAAGVQRAALPDLLALFIEAPAPADGGVIAVGDVRHRCNFFCRLFRHH